MRRFRRAMPALTAVSLTPSGLSAFLTRERTTLLLGER